MLTLIPLESKMLSLALWDPIQSHLHTPGVPGVGLSCYMEGLEFTQGEHSSSFLGFIFRIL